MNFAYNQKTQDYLARLTTFIRKNIEPVEQQIYRETHELNASEDWTKWQSHPLVEEFKGLAKQQGLWN